MFKQGDSSNRQKTGGCFLCFFKKFYGKLSVGLCLDTGKCFFLEVLFQKVNGKP